MILEIEAALRRLSGDEILVGKFEPMAAPDSAAGDDAAKESAHRSVEQGST